MTLSRGGFRIVQDRIADLRRAVVTEVENINQLIFHVLRGGVVVSVAILLFGFILAGLTGRPIPTTSLAPRFLGPGLYSFQPGAYLNLGVLILIFTPMARVFLSLLSFAEERDRTYVLLTAIVFANLLVSVFLVA